jgi:DNA polymerase-3 subunit epsilon
MSGPVLFIDTESTGVPDFSAPAEAAHQPNLVQLAWILADARTGRELRVASTIVRPVGWTIPADAIAVHGITEEMARKFGRALPFVLADFADVLDDAEMLVAHSIDFDRRIVSTAAHRSPGSGHSVLQHLRDLRSEKRLRCTLAENRSLSLSGQRFPSLLEVHQHYFGSAFESQHDALADVRACARVWFEMQRRAASTVQA